MNFPIKQSAILQFNLQKHLLLTVDDVTQYDAFWKPYCKHPTDLDSAVCCNWWPSRFIYDGQQFKTAEHAMMYAKAKLFNDPIAMSAILESHHPADAKAIGRQVRNFVTEVWDRECYGLVKDIVREKFRQNPTLLTWLKSQPVNTIFVEASPYDRLWGIGVGPSEITIINDVRQWKGYNLLGYICTEIKRELQ